MAAPISSLPTVTVDSAAFLGVAAPRRILPRLNIALSDRAYLPRVDDPEADWVASVAAPAFARLRATRGDAACRRFCALGTGSGMDALAAIEILGAAEVGLTDLFPEVVAAAARNVSAHLAPGVDISLHAGAGDLLTPLNGRGLRFDVIYENLPNLPLADDSRLEDSRTSGAFLPARTEPVSGLFKDNLLALHWVALVQARDYLAPGGAVLSTLGGRVPLSVITALAEQAGLVPDVFSFTWKVQAEPDEVIGAYAEWQAKGLGPFYFYRAEDLRRAFAGVEPDQSGARAAEIERTLAPHRLDAASAWAAHRAGERIGHTVVVLKSELPR